MPPLSSKRRRFAPAIIRRSMSLRSRRSIGLRDVDEKSDVPHIPRQPKHWPDSPIKCSSEDPGKSNRTAGDGSRRRRKEMTGLERLGRQAPWALARPVARRFCRVSLPSLNNSAMLQGYWHRPVAVNSLPAQSRCNAIRANRRSIQVSSHRMPSQPGSPNEASKCGWLSMGRRQWAQHAGSPRQDLKIEE